MTTNAAQKILEVPVIDIGPLMACADDASVAEVLREDHPVLGDVIARVRAAAAEWGFFYIRNHGVSEAQMQRFQAAMRAFFRLPKDVKDPLRRSPSNQRGFFDLEMTKNKVDWKQGFDMGGPQEDDSPQESPYERLNNDQNQWPPEDALPEFRSIMREYYADMTHIARRLIQVFAVALGERVDFFDQFFHQQIDIGAASTVPDHTSQFRLNYYPPSSAPEKTMGVYDHTDSGAVTVLLQDDEVRTLQVFHRESQTWVNVPPVKDTYVINIGDMVQVWSNDKFVAPVHRVLACAQERFSAPFFYVPSYRAVIQPIVVGAEEKPHYNPFNYREFRLRRFQENLADIGKEVQMSDYRIV